MVLGWTGGHTAGQKIPGDVVVVGDGARTAEQDAEGSCTRYPSMDAFRKAVAGKPEAQKPTPPKPEQPPPAAAKPEPDKFEGMDRVQLIRYGAEHFPRQRQWATLDSDKLKVELRRLEAASAPASRREVGD